MHETSSLAYLSHTADSLRFLLERSEHAALVPCRSLGVLKNKKHVWLIPFVKSLRGGGGEYMLLLLLTNKQQKKKKRKKRKKRKTDQCLCEFTPGLRKDVTLSGMGSPGSNMSMVDIHLRKLLWVYSPRHTGVKGIDRADRLAGKKATFTNDRAHRLVGKATLTNDRAHRLAGKATLTNDRAHRLAGKATLTNDPAHRLSGKATLTNDPAHRLSGKATLTNDPAHRLSGKATLTNDPAHRLAGKATLTNDPAHRLAGKTALTSGDTTCGDKPEDITPSIGWRREARKEKALDNLPWNDERGGAIVNQMNIGTVWKATIWETSETGWSAYGLFRAHRYHLELKWTELLLLDKQQTRALRCRNTYKQGRRNLHITVWTDTLIKSIYPARVLYISFSTTQSQKTERYMTYNNTQ